MEITVVIAITVALLIIWAILLGWYYQKLEDEQSLKDKEDYIAIGTAGAILIVAWPITLMMAVVGGIMYGIAMLTRKITRRRNGKFASGKVDL